MCQVLCAYIFGEYSYLDHSVRMWSVNMCIHSSVLYVCMCMFCGGEGSMLVRITLYICVNFYAWAHKIASNVSILACTHTYLPT
jgi:hypothetical protein